jgi:MerR family transcriptional regulator, heat shock protein HspR
MAPSPLEDEHAPLFTVGQVADMLAVKQAFLRRVDELRVVSPQRSAGGQRRYTRYEVRVIQQVVSMADEGITLQAIRRIIDLEQQLAEVTRQRDEVTRQRDELARLLAERPLPGPRSSRSGLGQLLQDRQRGG